MESNFAAQEELIVIGVAPVQSIGVPERTLPYHVQSATSERLERAQSLDLSDFLNVNLASVSLNEAQGNPLQPDVLYRGFTASPLLGLPQGLAVYQNGVRINEPLGDAVHWDLLPESAVHRIDLVGGANPLFGLNTLGGALAIQMKNGFNRDGHGARLSVGSFGRKIATLESGSNNGTFGWYVHAHYFEEDGWRDESPSEALNLYGSVGLRAPRSEINLNLQHAHSELTGNGTAPAELLQIRRKAIFTAPDITENHLYMLSADARHVLSDRIRLAGNVFYRRNRTHSLNGDASEFRLCELGEQFRLLEGLEEDDLQELDLDDDDVCESQFADVGALEDFLNARAAERGEHEAFDIDDLTGGLSGTDVLSDQAINNISDRTPESYGADLQATLVHDLFEWSNRLIAGSAYFRGTATFQAVLELAFLDPLTRSTAGLGTGTFLEDAATDIRTDSDTYSLYFTDALELTERLTLTLSGRFDNTHIELADRSGRRPELNARHRFQRFNPAVGVTFQATGELGLYGGYSESSRAPTPIELACNEHIFERAEALAAAAGEEPGSVDFECRLPNAFLADPPLEAVVTRNVEVGVRGSVRGLAYHLGAFHAVNRNDILFQTTGRATGLFANVRETRRRGVESSLRGTWSHVEAWLAYSYLEATFQHAFDVLSPLHPSADHEGTVRVEPGSRIPGLPEHQFKLGASWRASPPLSLGFDVVSHSGSHLRGDESNELATSSSFAIVNLRGRYRFNDRIELFARANNVFDSRYETFGLLGEDPSDMDVPLFQGFRDPRFLGPAAPRSVHVGIKLTL